MSAAQTYNQLRAGFDRAIQSLEKNLAYLRQKEGIPQRTIAMNEQIIKALNLYANQVENTIIGFQNEKIQSEKQAHNVWILTQKFEAICIIYGINDFPADMCKSMEWLRHTAQTNVEMGIFWLPNLILERSAKLTHEEKKQFNNLLDKMQHA